MKKTLLAAAASLLIAISAKAGFYSDNNPADVWLNAFNPSYSGQFTLAGYNPANETVTSAYTQFTFWDGFGSESLSVNLSGDTLTHGSFNGYLYLGGSGTIVNAWGILDSTGVLSYTVSLTSGGLSEFWLKNAYLSVNTDTRNVPDAGATSLLLALGVIGIVGAKRRFTSAA